MVPWSCEKQSACMCHVSNKSSLEEVTIRTPISIVFLSFGCIGLKRPMAQFSRAWTRMRRWISVTCPKSLVFRSPARQCIIKPYCCAVWSSPTVSDNYILQFESIDSILCNLQHIQFLSSLGLLQIAMCIAWTQQSTMTALKCTPTGLYSSKIWAQSIMAHTLATLLIPKVGRLTYVACSRGCKLGIRLSLPAFRIHKRDYQLLRRIVFTWISKCCSVAIRFKIPYLNMYELYLYFTLVR